MSKQTIFDKVGLLGVDIDVVSMSDAISYICDRAAVGQPSGYVAKPYVEYLDRCYQHPELAALIQDADLAIADGVALVWAAAYLYAGKRSWWRFWLTLSQIVLAPRELTWPLPNRAAGVSFTWPMLEAAASRGLRIFLVGHPLTTGDINRTAHAMIQTIPGLQIIGAADGRDPSLPPGRVSAEWTDQLAATLKASRPDLILLGLGFPLQEQLAGTLCARLDHGLIICEGGTFDYESFGGNRRRAPNWLRRVGLEWLWRAAIEPRRLGRQLAIPRFMWRIWRNR